MRVRQYVYFAIRSATLLPEEIAARVGIQPDRARLRGSRLTDPPRPREHVWEIRCDERGLRVDDQIARVLARLEPARAAIAALTATGNDARARLQVVREFDTEDGEEEIIETPDGPEKLAGQHLLLGWHADRSVLDFLQEVGADLDVDEYG